MRTIITVIIAIALLITIASCESKSGKRAEIQRETTWRLVYQDGKIFTYHKGDSAKVITLTTDSTATQLIYKRAH